MADDKKLHVLGDFDVWAIVSARLMKLTVSESNTVLEQLGITESDWEQACATWSTAVTNDVISGGGQVSKRYTGYFSRERRRRAAGEADPTIEELLSWKPAGLDPVIGGKVDVRHQATTSAANATSEPVKAIRVGNFVEDLAPAGPGPVAPSTDQLGTAPVDGSFGDEMRQARAAMAWSVEHYAQYCADLATQSDKAEFVRARYGLRTESVHHRVSDAWKQKFAQDPKLHATWAKLVAAHMSMKPQSTRAGAEATGPAAGTGTLLPEEAAAFVAQRPQQNVRAALPKQPGSETSPGGSPELGGATIPQTVGASDEPSERIREAREWPLGQWASICAELRHEPDRAQEIWTAWGFEEPELQQRLTREWDDFIRSDPWRQEKFHKLVTRYTARRIRLERAASS